MLNIQQLRQYFRRGGFEIVQPFPLIRYHRYFEERRNHSKNQRPIYEQITYPQQENTLALLIGNTYSIWEHFLHAYHGLHQFSNHTSSHHNTHTPIYCNGPRRRGSSSGSSQSSSQSGSSGSSHSSGQSNTNYNTRGDVLQEDIQHVSHPFDTFIENQIDYILEQFSNEIQNIAPVHKYYSHEFDHASNLPRIAIQAAAQVAGVSYYDNEISFLSFHPEFGPYISLRAVLVLEHWSIQDIDASEFKSPLHNYPIGISSLSSLESSLSSASSVASSNNHSTKLTTTQEQSNIHALRAQLQEQLNRALQQPHDMRQWIQLRDVPLQFQKEWKKYRFSEDQIKYHYFKNIKYLSQQNQNHDQSQQKQQDDQQQY